MSKNKWKTTSVQDCGCKNQQRYAYATTIPIKPGENKMRIKPCAEHAPPTKNEECSWTYEEFWDLW